MNDSFYVKLSIGNLLSTASLLNTVVQWKMGYVHGKIFYVQLTPHFTAIVTILSDNISKRNYDVISWYNSRTTIVLIILHFDFSIAKLQYSIYISKVIYPIRFPVFTAQIYLMGKMVADCPNVLVHFEDVGIKYQPSPVCVGR